MRSLFAAGDPIVTLETLAAFGVTVTLGRDRQQLHVRPRPVGAVSAELVRANRSLIHAVLFGAHTGHAWARCDECGAGVMRKKNAGSKKCVITPGCEGQLRRAHGPTDRGVISPGSHVPEKKEHSS
jgi:hypothetical protein